jgi:putative FmdB family regulatory protein
MPIYEYRCRECGEVFDAFQRVGEDGEELECPKCGTPRPEKLFSSFASAGSSSTSGSCVPRGGFT